MTDTRKVRQSPRPPSRPAIRRLGKVRGSIIDALDASGGTLTLRQIADVLHKKRPRDIRRRNLPMLEDAGIISVSEAGDVVSLTANWLEALEAQRRLGREIDSVVVLTYTDAQGEEREKVSKQEGAETIARRRYTQKRDAYHKRRSKLPTKHKRSPKSVASLAVRSSHEAREAGLIELARRPKPQREGPDLTEEQERIVRQRVREGMRRDFAIESVVARTTKRDAACSKASEQERSEPKPSNASERKMPPKKDGVYVHGPECDCWLCSDSESEAAASEPSEEIDEGKLRAG